MSEEIFTRWVDPTIEEKDKEIERLKESEEYHRKGFAELYKRIDEAIEYINKNGIIDLNGYDLLNILQGSDKE